MHTTATVHIHPACAANRERIEKLEATSGCLVVIHHGKPRLVSRRTAPTPFDPNDGGRAA